MSAWAGWRIDLIDGATLTDITSYVQGFRINTKINIGRFSPTNVTLTLNNDGGQFTPAAGGGTGTFAATDWLTKAIRIGPSDDAASSSVRAVFVSDFAMRDNGTESSVKLSCQDWLSVASSQQFDIVENTTTTDFATFVENVLKGTSGFGDGATFPTFGITPTSINVQVSDFMLSDETPDQIARPAASNVTSLDYINRAMFNGYPSIIIPIDAGISGTAVGYAALALNRTLTYKSVSRLHFAFSENPSGTTLPFAQIQPGFEFDDLTSTVEVKSGMTGVATQTSTNSDTGNKYGTRARRYSSTGNKVISDSADDAGAVDAAQFWTNRQSTPRYIPRRLLTSIELVEDRNGSAAAATLKNLLSYYFAWMQPCDITYTPTGGNQVTANCVIAGRTIEAVPGRTTITLDLLPAVDYQSFILDSTTLGILDTNRLG
tara:strand:+ start:196 stop:1491 length:1296 start_codon:yes stop_codon:yes gene_type:complete